jgi:hypothetical protein
MQEREMNLFDFCQAIGKGIGKAVMWLVRGLGEMIRLTYRQWWVVMLVVVACVAAGLYYARENNRMYEVNAVAQLNGVTNEMVRAEFEALGKVRAEFVHQNPMAILGLPADLAWANSHFAAYDVIDLLADSTVDMVDYHRNVDRMDTLCVHMPNMVALQFRTKQPNRLPELEEAILRYLNTRPYMQSLYTAYRQGLEREARFHADQVDKLDSLTSVFYFKQNTSAQVQMDAWKSGMVLGSRSMDLFLEDVYKEMRESEYVHARLAACTAPVVLQSHFVAEARAENGPLRMTALALVAGWLLGLLVAALVDKRKQIIVWLKA